LLSFHIALSGWLLMMHSRFPWLKVQMLHRASLCASAQQAAAASTIEPLRISVLPRMEQSSGSIPDPLHGMQALRNDPAAQVSSGGA
jgi:hypothetical protein